MKFAWRNLEPGTFRTSAGVSLDAAQIIVTLELCSQ
jgi:hypothetical protein